MSMPTYKFDDADVADGFCDFLELYGLKHEQLDDFTVKVEIDSKAVLEAVTDNGGEEVK
jgi:hypothetical protein